MKAENPVASKPEKPALDLIEDVERVGAYHQGDLTEDELRFLECFTNEQKKKVIRKVGRKSSTLSH